MTRQLDGVAEIVGRFDAVLIDQYGVLHDGRQPLPGAVACVEALRDRGIPLVALTNSGKRAAANLARLDRLGFAETMFTGLVSSGELVRNRLMDMLETGALAPGSHVAVISRDGDQGPLEGLPFHGVPPDPQAALLLIAGAEPERIGRADYATMLAPLALRGVPALCANPDTVIYTDSGPSFGAGVIAADYRAAGGQVEMLGKPARAMFEAGLAMLGHPAPQRVLMIGDSPAHDIAGASAAGCQTLLIRGGVQSSEQDAAHPADFEIDRLRWDPVP